MRKIFITTTILVLALNFGCKKYSRDVATPTTNLDAASLALTGRWVLNLVEWDPNADGKILLSPVTDFPCIANTVFDLNIDGTYLDQNLGKSVCYLKPAPVNGIFTIDPSGKKFAGKWALTGKSVLFTRTDSLGVSHKFSRTLSQDNVGYILSITDTLTSPGRSYSTLHYRKQ